MAVSVMALGDIHATAQSDSATPPSVPAQTWAVDCVNHEVNIIQHPNSFLRYRLHTIDDKGDQVRDQIETPSGTVSRLILRDGRPLTAKDDSAERDRLTSLTDSPSSLARHARHDEENRRQGVEMVKMMPDAMLWSYAAGQPQPSNRPAGDPPLVVLDFKPNPKWSPPTLQSELLTGLAGRIWIDPRTRNMVRLEATLVRAVNIGWGMLAHLYPGGTATLQQVDVGGQRWMFEHIDEQLNLQALLVKSVRQRLVSDATGFQAVSPMSPQQAIRMLLDTPLPAR